MLFKLHFGLVPNLLGPNLITFGLLIILAIGSVHAQKLALAGGFFVQAPTATQQPTPAAQGQLKRQQDEQQEILLWPDGLPRDSVRLDQHRIEELKEKERQHPRGHLLFVDEPSLTVYPVKQETPGCGVIICPGGGYNLLAWEHEGVALAEWFNSIGITAFVLKYRVPRRIPDQIHWEPMQDVQRAIRTVRHKASEFNIATNKIGVLGFSAGGHLTVMAGTQFNTKCYEPEDEIDGVSARPDFICPIYAAYLGENYRDDHAELGSLVTVTDNTPPTFMAVTWDDRFRGAQAALLFAELKRHSVPAELHIYAKGGHGYGIQPSEQAVSNWHHHLQTWLEASEFKPSLPK